MIDRTLYCIQDAPSQAWVTSSRLTHLGAFEGAAIFHTASAAERAIREMNRRIKEHGLFQLHGVMVFTSRATAEQAARSRHLTYDKLMAHGHAIAPVPPIFRVVPCTLREASATTQESR